MPGRASIAGAATPGRIAAPGHARTLNWRWVGCRCGADTAGTTAESGTRARPQGCWISRRVCPSQESLWPPPVCQDALNGRLSPVAALANRASRTLRHGSPAGAPAGWRRGDGGGRPVEAGGASPHLSFRGLAPGSDLVQAMVTQGRSSRRVARDQAQQGVAVLANDRGADAGAADQTLLVARPLGAARAQAAVR